MRYLLLPVLLLLSAVRLWGQTPPLTTGEQPLPQTEVRLPLNVMLTTIDSTREISAQKIWGNADKPVVLAFWLTTCGPCKMELATYTRLYQQWKSSADFDLYAISTDFPQRFRQIANIVQANKYPFPVYWDGDRRFRDLLPGGLNGLPQIFLFDRQGKLVYHHRKFRPGDENELFARIQALQN